MLSTESLPYLHCFHFYFMNHLSWYQSPKRNRFHRRTEPNHGTNVLWLLERDVYAIFKSLEDSALSMEPVSRHKVLKGSNITRSLMTTSASSIAKAFDMVIGRTTTR